MSGFKGDFIKAFSMEKCLTISSHDFFRLELKF